MHILKRGGSFLEGYAVDEKILRCLVIVPLKVSVDDRRHVPEYRSPTIWRPALALARELFRRPMHVHQARDRCRTLLGVRRTHLPGPEESEQGARITPEFLTVREAVETRNRLDERLLEDGDGS